jgi:hypothetical protein
LINSPTFDRPRGILVRKPRTTVYTVLLGIAVGALAIGCLLLAVEIMRYGSLLSAWEIPAELR